MAPREHQCSIRPRICAGQSGLTQRQTTPSSPADVPAERDTFEPHSGQHWANEFNFTTAPSVSYANECRSSSSCLIAATSWSADRQCQVFCGVLNPSAFNQSSISA